MSLTTYIKGLVSSFKREKVVDSLNATKQMLKDQTIPSVTVAADLFKDRSFKSKEMRDFVNSYGSTVEKVTDNKFLYSILDVLNNSVVLLDYIASVTKNEFSDVETNVNLTYKKSAYMRTIQTAEFVSSYTRKFINYVFILETSEASEHFTVKDALVAQEIKWLDDNYVNYINCIRVLNINKEHFKSGLLHMPDSVINDLQDTTLPNIVGISKFDPLRMNNITVAWNPFYLVGLWYAEQQADKYKAAQSELELVQLRKHNLEKIYAQTPDPKLEKQIAYMQNRVDDLQYKLQKKAEEYNV